MGNYAEALVHHRRTLELDPSNINILFNLGVPLEEGDVDMDEAIAVYERALELDAAGTSTSPPGQFRPVGKEKSWLKGIEIQRNEGGRCCNNLENNI